MLSRILFVFLITGLGQILSIAALKLLARDSSVEQLRQIADADVTIQLIIGIIAFGLQSAAIRNIALRDDWRYEIQEVQKSRITLSLFLSIGAVLAFWDWKYILFLAAPLFAVNADYALYGRGRSVAGAGIAFFRTMTPFLFCLVAIWLASGELYVWYIAGALIAYAITNSIICLLLGTALIQRPRLASLISYRDSIPLGVVTLNFYFLGLGILFLAGFFIDDASIAISFLGLKLYVIYKGALRVFHQAFVREMVDDAFCLLMDKCSTLFGLLFLSAVAFFPNSFISLFFGSQFLAEAPLFISLAATGLIYSLFLSMTTQSLLRHRDIAYMKINLIGFGVSVLSFFISILFFEGWLPIVIGLVGGELLVAIGLAAKFLTSSQVVTRLRFFLVSLLVLSIPLAARVVFPDTIFILVGTLVIMILIFAVVNFDTVVRPIVHLKRPTE